MNEIPLRHLARYSEIISIFLRYGLGYFVLENIPLPPILGLGRSNRRYSETELGGIGVRLRGALTELGPTFIKLGQLACTRSDLIAQPIIKELTQLQNQVRPLPFATIRQLVETSLQQRLDTIFLEFNPIPLAAASIAQVHQAVLKTGEKVVVKVQRPHLREIAEIDLEIFGFLIVQFEQRTEWGKSYPLQTIFREFSRTLLEELDFLNEGKNTEKLTQYNKTFIIPKIYWEFSTASVLTQEFIPGTPLRQMVNVQSSSLEHNLSLIAEQLCQGILHQILIVGYFHGDPHPGNILILPDGKIALIDFGIVGTLTNSMRHQLADLIDSLIAKKNDRLLQVIAQMGIIPEQMDRTQFLQDISGMRSKYLLNPQSRGGLGEAIQDFFNIINDHRIYIPSEYVLIAKCLLTLEGILHQMDPNLSLVGQIKPYTRRLLWDKFNPIRFLTRITKTLFPLNPFLPINRKG
ncbi:ABC1 kinase family protein [Desulfitobacterium sp.]|uniref:ABC1 kinase family protein n=1 Tax=Desulfitobacterium sp. TaxID=49981 RepID=UPI002B211606|nr:AarF/UbiB family protein [Desulfitobacterium sp.]MEA4902582.1 AarF/UbiB family protein [Desulfitobacterium sp.]